MRIQKGFLENKKEIFKENIGYLQQVYLWNLLEMNATRKTVPLRYWGDIPRAVSSCSKDIQNKEAYSNLKDRNSWFNQLPFFNNNFKV